MLATPTRSNAESVSVREINQRLLKTNVFDYQAAGAALPRLQQPRAIKDPQFAQTLSVTKDHDLVVESYVRRGTSRERVEQREVDCARHFADWPWGRFRVDAAQIASADWPGFVKNR